MLMPSIFGESLLDDFFDEFNGGTRNRVRYAAPSNGVMRTDIKESADDYEISIDLPGYQKEDVPYVVMAEELGVGSADLEKLRIVPCNDFTDQHRTVPQRKVVEVQDAVDAVDSCSACYGYLVPELARLKEEGLLQKLDEKICMGQGFRGKTGNLGIGNCTRKFAHTLEGCPPMPDEMYRFLKDYIKK